MSQTSKTLVMLAVVLVIAGGIGGYAYFGVFQNDQKVKKQQEHDLRLFAPQKLDERAADGGSPPAEFTKLTVTSHGTTTQLERVPGKEWRIVSPLKAQADRTGARRNRQLAPDLEVQGDPGGEPRRGRAQEATASTIPPSWWRPARW